MPTTLPLRQEIILGPDGKFIKRETRESVIADADTAITACMRDDTLCMSNIPISIPVLNREYHCYYAHNSGINPEHCYAFVNLADGFPLPGAKFRPSDKQNIYHLFVPSYREREGENDTPDDVVEPTDIPMYNNTDYAIWVMIRFNCRHLGTKDAKLQHANESMTAYLFGIHKESRNITTFNLPNIYDDGRICGGNDFRDEQLIHSPMPIGHLQTAVTYLMNVLFKSPCNRDLYYHERVIAHAWWYRDSNDFATVPTSSMKRYDEDYQPQAGFFQSITNSHLIDFASCLQSTTN
jgi:hypothetical protein